MLMKRNVICDGYPYHVKPAFLIMSVVFSTAAVTGFPQKGNGGGGGGGGGGGTAPRQTRFEDMIGFPSVMDRETALIDDMYPWSGPPPPKFRMGNPVSSTFAMRPPQSYRRDHTRTILSKVGSGTDMSKSLAVDAAIGSDHVVFLDKKVSTSTPPMANSSEASINTRVNLAESFVPSKADAQKCMLGVPLCNQTNMYPRSHVQGLVGSNKLIRELFGTDEIFLSSVVETRFDNSAPKKSFCSTLEYIHFPTIGETKAGDLRYILQHKDSDNEYTQGIRLEVCSNSGENNKCELGSLRSNMPLGYTTECVQKYTYRKLVSLTPKGQPTQEQFKVPSCCICMYKQD